MNVSEDRYTLISQWQLMWITLNIVLQCNILWKTLDPGINLDVTRHKSSAQNLLQTKQTNPWHQHISMIFVAPAGQSVLPQHKTVPWTWQRALKCLQIPQIQIWLSHGSHQVELLPWRVSLCLKCSLGEFYGSKTLHMNARTKGFLTESCTEQCHSLHL